MSCSTRDGKSFCDFARQIPVLDQSLQTLTLDRPPPPPTKHQRSPTRPQPNYLVRGVGVVARGNAWELGL